LIREIDDGNLSDLRPEEIPDENVSDVEATQINVEQIENQGITTALV
jgi:hypothetical protein